MTGLPNTVVEDHAHESFIANVVAMVVARLADSKTAESKTQDDPGHLNQSSQVVAITERVISGPLINDLPQDVSCIQVSSSAVMTPSAMDEARARGLKIDWVTEKLSLPELNNKPAVDPKPADSTTIRVRDLDDAERGASVVQQLMIRKIVLPSNRMVWLSDQPARTVHQVIEEGNRAVMITELGDVDRFNAELRPTDWVIDMKRVNLIAAVNVIARISLKGVS